MNYFMILASSTEGVNPVKSVGNIFFYILLAVLVVAVVTICLIFTRSKTFKVHLREKMKEKNDVYIAPKLVKIYDDQVKEEIQFNIEKELKEQEDALEQEKQDRLNGIHKESHIIEYSSQLEKDKENEN